MLIRIAQRAQARAERTGKAKHIKRAWFWRELASWVRGGEWTAFPDHETRRRKPRTTTTIRFAAPGPDSTTALSEAGRDGRPPAVPAGIVARGA